MSGISQSDRILGRNVIRELYESKLNVNEIVEGTTNDLVELRTILCQCWGCTEITSILLDLKLSQLPRNCDPRGFSVSKPHFDANLYYRIRKHLCNITMTTDRASIECMRWDC